MKNNMLETSGVVTSTSHMSHYAWLRQAAHSFFQEVTRFPTTLLHGGWNLRVSDGAIRDRFKTQTAAPHLWRLGCIFLRRNHVVLYKPLLTICQEYLASDNNKKDPSQKIFMHEIQPLVPLVS
jgi:hypothetical protein